MAPRTAAPAQAECLVAAAPPAATAAAGGGAPLGVAPCDDERARGWAIADGALTRDARRACVAADADGAAAAGGALRAVLVPMRADADQRCEPVRLLAA